MIGKISFDIIERSRLSENTFGRSLKGSSEMVCNFDDIYQNGIEFFLMTFTVDI